MIRSEGGGSLLVLIRLPRPLHIHSATAPAEPCGRGERFHVLDLEAADELGQIRGLGGTPRRGAQPARQVLAPAVEVVVDAGRAVGRVAPGARVLQPALGSRARLRAAASAPRREVHQLVLAEERRDCSLAHGVAPREFVCSASLACVRLGGAVFYYSPCRQLLKAVCSEMDDDGESLRVGWFFT